MNAPEQANEQDGTRGAYASYLTRSAQQDALTKFLADDMGMEFHDAHLLAAEITLSRWFDDVRREAKAEALREASHFTTDADFRFNNLADVRDWLRNRAAAVESGDPS